MRWAVIADDLTGVAGTGVQFAKRGQSTLVLLEWEGVGLGEASVVGPTPNRATSRSGGVSSNLERRTRPAPGRRGVLL